MYKTSSFSVALPRLRYGCSLGPRVGARTRPRCPPPEGHSPADGETVEGPSRFGYVQRALKAAHRLTVTRSVGAFPLVRRREPRKNSATTRSNGGRKTASCAAANALAFLFVAPDPRVRLAYSRWSIGRRRLLSLMLPEPLRILQPRLRCLPLTISSPSKTTTCQAKADPRWRTTKNKRPGNPPQATMRRPEKSWLGTPLPPSSRGAASTSSRSSTRGPSWTGCYPRLHPGSGTKRTCD